MVSLEEPWVYGGVTSAVGWHHYDLGLGMRGKGRGNIFCVRYLVSAHARGGVRHTPFVSASAGLKGSLLVHTRVKEQLRVYGRHFQLSRGI
jgi:hypothetical protein